LWLVIRLIAAACCNRVCILLFVGAFVGPWALSPPNTFPPGNFGLFWWGLIAHFNIIIECLEFSGKFFLIVVYEGLKCPLQVTDRFYTGAPQHPQNLNSKCRKPMFSYWSMWYIDLKETLTHTQTRGRRQSRASTVPESAPSPQEALGAPLKQPTPPPAPPSSVIAQVRWRTPLAPTCMPQHDVKNRNAFNFVIPLYFFICKNLELPSLAQLEKVLVKFLFLWKYLLVISLTKLTSVICVRWPNLCIFFYQRVTSRRAPLYNQVISLKGT
jgi:hypothetical protein